MYQVFDSEFYHLLFLLHGHTAHTAPEFRWALALMIDVFLSFFRNQFVTKTFPNHWSIVTGVYEEVHGLVGNTVYDKALNITHSITDHALFSQNPSIIPIWVRIQYCIVLCIILNLAQTHFSAMHNSINNYNTFYP